MSITLLQSHTVEISIVLLTILHLFLFFRVRRLERLKGVRDQLREKKVLKQLKKNRQQKK
jgi:hypothetical protein